MHFSNFFLCTFSYSSFSILLLIISLYSTQNRDKCQAGAFHHLLPLSIHIYQQLYIYPDIYMQIRKYPLFSLSYCKSVLIIIPRIGPMSGWIPVSKRWIDIGADVNSRSLNILLVFRYLHFSISTIYPVNLVSWPYS